MEKIVEGTANDDDDEFGLNLNGRIASNMFLVAWKRDENRKLHIQIFHNNI